MPGLRAAPAASIGTCRSRSRPRAPPAAGRRRHPSDVLQRGGSEAAWHRERWRAPPRAQRAGAQRAAGGAAARLWRRARGARTRADARFSRANAGVRSVRVCRLRLCRVRVCAAFGRAQIKSANERFNNTSSRYEITLANTSEVTPVRAIASPRLLSSPRGQPLFCAGSRPDPCGLHTPAPEPAAERCCPRSANSAPSSPAPPLAARARACVRADQRRPARSGLDSGRALQRGAALGPRRDGARAGISLCGVQCALVAWPGGGRAEARPRVEGMMAGVPGTRAGLGFAACLARRAATWRLTLLRRAPPLRAFAPRQQGQGPPKGLDIMGALLAVGEFSLFTSKAGKELKKVRAARGPDGRSGRTASGWRAQPRCARPS